MLIDALMAREYYEVIRRRHSSRTFTAHPLSEDQTQALERLTVEPLGLARCDLKLVHQPGQLDHVFTGVIGSYGKTRGVSALLALLVPSGSGWQGKMECGYVGEQFVLKATASGVGSCWNAGMYDFKRLMGLVPVGPLEEVSSLVALGITKDGPDKLGSITKRFIKQKTVAQISTPELLDFAPWVPEAVEAVRRAPSAINRQPWFLSLMDRSIILSAVKSGSFVPIDLGIAMLHFRVAALAQGIDGRWEVESQERAVFRLSP